MFDFLVRLYRANPFRPHCNGATGYHVLLCRLLIAEDNCKRYHS